MEKTIFIDYFGNTPKIRILDLLLTGRELDYSISDISQHTKIGRATFYRLLNDLLKNEIIIITRKVGNIQLYKLNMNNKDVVKIAAFYDALLSGKKNKLLTP